MDALQVAKEFNRDVLKGQLNPDGTVVAELARRIEEFTKSTTNTAKEQYVTRS